MLKKGGCGLVYEFEEFWWLGGSVRWVLVDIRW
jgi:hypothetical protein